MDRPDRQTTLTRRGSFTRSRIAALHLDAVAVGQHDDRGPAAARASLDQLADDGEDLLAPAEDQDMVMLEDAGAALAQGGQPLLEAVAQDADQGADDEDAAQRHRQHPEQEARASLVAAHGARVERAHGRHPGELEGIAAVVAADQDRTRTTPRMISSETTKSPAMSAIVPRSMNRSKR